MSHLGKSSYENETALLIKKAGRRRDLVNTEVWGRRSSLPSSRGRRLGSDGVEEDERGDEKTRPEDVGGRRRRRAQSAEPARTSTGSQEEETGDLAIWEAYMAMLRINIAMCIDFVPEPPTPLDDEIGGGGGGGGEIQAQIFERLKSCPADMRRPPEDGEGREYGGEGGGEEEEEEYGDLQRCYSMMGKQSGHAYESLAAELGIEEDINSRARAMGDMIADELVDGMSYMDFLRPFTTAAFAVGSLLVFEGLGFRVWRLVFGPSSTAAFALGLLPLVCTRVLPADLLQLGRV